MGCVVGVDMLERVYEHGASHQDRELLTASGCGGPPDHSPQIAKTGCGSLLSQTKAALPYHSSPKSVSDVSLPMTNTLRSYRSVLISDRLGSGTGEHGVDRPALTEREDERIISRCHEESSATMRRRRQGARTTGPALADNLKARSSLRAAPIRRLCLRGADDAVVEEAGLVCRDRPVLPRVLAHQRVTPLLGRRAAHRTVGRVNHLRRRRTREGHRAVGNHRDRTGRVVRAPFVLDGDGCLEERHVGRHREQRRVAGIGGHDRRRRCLRGRRFQVGARRTNQTGTSRTPS